MSAKTLREKHDKEEHIAAIFFDILIIISGLTSVLYFVTSCLFGGMFIFAGAVFLIRNFFCENKNIGI